MPMENETVFKPNDLPRNYRHFLVKRDAMAMSFEYQLADKIEVWRRENNTKYQEFLEKNEQRSVFTMEHLLPLQRGIHCFHENAQLEVLFSIPMNVSYSAICLIGPERSFTNSTWEYGTPGGSCKSGDSSESGLCISKYEGHFEPFGPLNSVVPPKKAKKPVGRRDEYIDIVHKLNAERAEFARAFNISNMYKLEWVDSLSEGIESDKLGEDYEYIPKSLLLPILGNKDAMLYETHMRAQLESLRKKNQTLRQWGDEIHKKYTSLSVHWRLLDYLAPSIAAIGCKEVLHEKERKLFSDVLVRESPGVVPVRDDVKFYGKVLQPRYGSYCFMAPRKKFSAVNYQWGTPATGCGVHYKDSFSGLCSRRYYKPNDSAFGYKKKETTVATTSAPNVTTPNDSPAIEEAGPSSTNAPQWNKDSTPFNEITFHGTISNGTSLPEDSPSIPEDSPETSTAPESSSISLDTTSTNAPHWNNNTTTGSSEDSTPSNEITFHGTVSNETLLPEDSPAVEETSDTPESSSISTSTSTNAPHWTTPQNEIHETVPKPEGTPIVFPPSSNETSTARPTTGAPKPELKSHGYEDLVTKINYERREFAKAMNVSNMYKLIWSEQLAERAQKFPLNGFSQNETRFRYFFAGRNKDGFIFEAEQAYWLLSLKNQTELNKFKEENEMRSLVTLEQFLPLQKVIGCAPWKRPPFHYKTVDMDLNVQYSVICALGPEKSYKNSIRKTAPPASECGVDGAEDGLCVPNSQNIDGLIEEMFAKTV